MRCEQVRKVILQQTLEGGFSPAADLAEHLRGCPDCHDLLLRVAEVDSALRALPLEQMPAWSVRGMIAGLSPAGQRQEPFMPWTLWLPIGSLLIGFLWAYITLIWPTGPDAIRSFDPRVGIWLAQFEEWVVAQQAVFNVVALSVGVGLVFTVLAIGLGLYVGRDRITARRA